MGPTTPTDPIPIPIPIPDENDNDDEEEEEEDEDFVPEKDDDDSEAGCPVPTTSETATDEGMTAVSRLTPTQRSAVDEAFLSLFGDGPTPLTTASAAAEDPVPSNAATKRATTAKKGRKRARVLEEIFGGPSVASKLMATARRSAEGYGGKKRNASVADFTEERRVVKETKRFAGGVIEVERVVTVSAADRRGGGNGTVVASTAADLPAKPQGIDSLLTQLDNPQKISTVAKTDADWELFKDRAGLEEELAKKAEGKDAFLVKKDFLDRVDQRKFEMEKVVRERKRAAAASGQGGK